MFKELGSHPWDGTQSLCALHILSLDIVTRRADRQLRQVLLMSCSSQHVLLRLLSLAHAKVAQLDRDLLGVVTARAKHEHILCFQVSMVHECMFM